MSVIRDDDPWYWPILVIVALAIATAITCR